MAHPNIKTVSGTFGWNEADQGYENEWYGRRFTPELARAIRKYKISPADYDAIALRYDYTDPAEQRRLAKNLDALAARYERERANERLTGLRPVPVLTSLMRDLTVGS